MEAHHALAPIDVDDSIEALLGNHPTATRTVYLVVLAVVLAATGATALTSVDLTVRAPATLRPLVERQSIRAAVDGTVDQVLVARGDAVHAGDTLVRFVSTATDVARAATDAALREQRDLVHDLRLLLHADPAASDTQLRAPRLEAAWRGATLEWRQASARVQQNERARDRLRQLGERGFAVPAELETAQFELAHAREERALQMERHRSGWAEELAAARQRAAELERDRARQKTDRSAYAVIAPVDGTVEELASVAAGSVVRGGDAMATVSPNAGLVAEVLVAPRTCRSGAPRRASSPRSRRTTWSPPTSRSSASACGRCTPSSGVRMAEWCRSRRGSAARRDS
jgi:multidrug efflux pump subunit AcrA (membrane-fusion protein)